MPGHRIPDNKKIVIKSLVDAGMSYREIQHIMDVSPASITNIVREFEANKPLVEYYKRNRRNILAYDQLRCRGYITDEKLEKASAKDLEIMRSICHDKERLEGGESTENVAVIIRALQEAKEKEFREMELEGKGEQDEEEEKPDME